MPDEVRRKRYDTEEKKAKNRARASAWRIANPDKLKVLQARSRVNNREKNRLAAAAWRAANPEKAKATQAASYAKHKAKRKKTAALWNAANREKIKRDATAWRKANPEKSKALYDKWRKANPGKCKAMSAAWVKANPDKVKQQQKKWKRKNREHVKAVNAAWHAANLDRAAVKRAVRRAREAGAPGKFSAEDIAFLVASQNGLCAAPGCNADIRYRRHVDHVMPLALGGSNDRDNLQILCPTCNLSKGALHPAIFLARRSAAMQEGLRAC